MDAISLVTPSTSSNSMSVLILQLPTTLPGSTLKDMARLWEACSRTRHPVVLPEGIRVIGLTLSGEVTSDANLDYAPRVQS